MPCGSIPNGGGERPAASKRTVRADVVVGPGEGVHVEPGTAEQSHLGVDDGVFAAELTIAVVEDEDAHWSPSTQECSRNV